MVWQMKKLIGKIKLEWNWLVGEYEHKDDVNNVHWTKGGLILKIM